MITQGRLPVTLNSNGSIAFPAAQGFLFIPFPFVSLNPTRRRWWVTHIGVRFTITGDDGVAFTLPQNQLVLRCQSFNRQNPLFISNPTQFSPMYIEQLPATTQGVRIYYTLPVTLDSTDAWRAFTTGNSIDYDVTFYIEESDALT